MCLIDVNVYLVASRVNLVQLSHVRQFTKYVSIQLVMSKHQVIHYDLRNKTSARVLSR